MLILLVFCVVLCFVLFCLSSSCVLCAQSVFILFVFILCLVCPKCFSLFVFVLCLVCPKCFYFVCLRPVSCVPKVFLVCLSSSCVLCAQSVLVCLSSSCVPKVFLVCLSSSCVLCAQSVFILLSLDSPSVFSNFYLEPLFPNGTWIFNAICVMSFFMCIRVITKLPNSEQSYKGKVKTHNYINRQNQSTTGKL
jgi:hypothetical protein